jgi:hypothetical protein
VPLRCAQEKATFRDNETIKQNDFFPGFPPDYMAASLSGRFMKCWRTVPVAFLMTKKLSMQQGCGTSLPFSLSHPSLMHYLVSLSRQLNSSVRKQMPTLSIFINDSKISNHFKGCFSGTINRQKTQSPPKCPFCSAFFSINIFYS